MKMSELKKKIKTDWSKIDPKQFKMGMVAEREHRDITKGDPIKTAKIVLAHLKEKKNYYTLLKKVEK